MTGAALDRVLDALRTHGRRVTTTHGTTMAQCPAHEDGRPSLHVDSKDGKVLLRCFADCDTREIVSAIGLQLGDLFDAPAQSTGSDEWMPNGLQFVASYDYTDENGTLLFQVVRGMDATGGKSFLQRHPDPGKRSGWCWKLADCLADANRFVPWHLPEVLDAVRRGAPVWIAEGEKDADALRRQGVVATCNAGGAGKWRAQHSAWLKGAHVVITRDMDEPGAKHQKQVEQSLAGIAASVRLVQPAKGKDAFDHFAAGLTLEDFASVAATPTAASGEVASQARQKYGQSQDDDDHGDGKRSAAAVLVDLALERYRFGCTPDGEPFGVPLDGGHVVRLLRGSRTSLRAELASLYRKKTGRIAAQQALADALLVLEGEAQEAEPELVHLRVAQHRGVLWVDLGDAAERAVKVAGGSWSVVDRDVPVLFRRSALTGAMPTPVAGDLGELWQLLNVAERDRPLVLGWLVAALGAPDVSHPILALFGEQGTGKSTASRLLVDLVDPSPVPLRKPPRDMDSWVTAAAGSWVVGLDNLSAVPDWLSDTLCRAATGDGDVRRQLYTDSGLSVFAFRRVLLLNGIDLGGLRGDLTERLLAIQLEPIPDDRRRTERGLAEAWEDARPRLLGALLGEVARMASTLPYVRLGSSPRMADFASVLAALDDVGLERYLEQARSLSADSLSADPFIMAMIGSLTEAFTGKASELLPLVTPDDRLPKDWPKNARQVTTTLRRNAPALRRQGWTVDDLGSANKENATIWLVVPPEIARNPASPTSPNSPTSPQEPVDRPVADPPDKPHDPPPCPLVWPDGRPHRFHPMAGCWSCDGGVQ